MLRTLTYCTLLAAAAPSFGATLSCTGTQPNWQAQVEGDTATFQLRDRAGDYSVELVTPAKDDPETIAYTLIGSTDTAILITFPSRCNTAAITAHVLTQDRAEAVLLTGCCTAAPQ